MRAVIIWMFLAALVVAAEPPRAVRVPGRAVATFPEHRAPAAGDRGKLTGGRFLVNQVVDGRQALIQLYWTRRGPRGVELMREQVLLRDYPTDDLLDGRVHETKDSFEVVGTAKFATKDGSRKILAIEPVGH